jgi:hypothetical protein
VTRSLSPSAAHRGALVVAVVASAAILVGSALALLDTRAVSAPSPSGGYPTASSVGVPPGWQPVREHQGDLWVREAGAVLEDVRITDGVLFVDAPNVTVRRVELVGGRIENTPFNECHNGLVVEDATITRSTRPTADTDQPVIGVGGYTARNVSLDNVPEGFRVGGRSMGCTDVLIENTYVNVTPPDVCNDWHGDAIQGYDGPALTVRNTTLVLTETAGCGGTAAFFYPHSQGNVSADIDRLLVAGGGYPFRLGMPGSVTNLKIVDGSWGYGPIDVKCSVVTAWDAQIVTLDPNGQPQDQRPQPCTTESGS